MADKKELRKELKELKKKLVLNCKDAHFANETIKEIIQKTKALQHEPTFVHIPIEEGSDVYKGDTFEMYSSSKGVVYRTYGGYTLYADRNSGNAGLCGIIDDITKGQIEQEGLTEEQKGYLNNAISALTYCLNAPLLCSNNAELMFDVATHIVDYLIKLQEKYIEDEQELQEETYEEDEEFKEASIAIEDIKKAISEEVAE